MRVRREYVDLPWGQVHVRRCGAVGAPALLLLHQSPLSSRTFDAALPHLGNRFDVIAADTPGYGASSAPLDPWSVPDYAHAFWETLNALEVGKVTLFGRATGTVFAVAMAHQHPHRTQGLVLHGAPLYTEEEKAQRLAKFAPPYRADPSGAHLSWIWERITGEYPWSPPELRTAFVQDYLSAGPDFASSYRAIWRYDMAGALREVPLRPCLLAGTADRIFHMHERISALLPQAPTLVLPDATDFVAMLDPERFATAVTQLLD